MEGRIAVSRARRLFRDVLGTAPLGLLLATGCVQQASPPVVSETPVPAMTKVQPEKDLPKRAPKADTCAAYGAFYLKAATEQVQTPLQREQMLDQARRSFQQALKTDPKNLEASRGLARTYEEVGDKERALGTYSKVLKDRPQEASVWYDLGMYQARRREWAPALDALDHAVRLDPENRAYGTAQAYALARAGRFEESFASFNRLVGEAHAHYNVARMLHHVHQEEQCRDHLRKAIQADPTFADAKQLLAEMDGSSSTTIRQVSVGFEPLDQADTVRPASTPWPPATH